MSLKIKSIISLAVASAFTFYLFVSVTYSPSAFALPFEFRTPESPNAINMNNLYNFISFPAAFIFLVFELSLLYVVIRYRRKSPDQMPKQIEGNLALEITWTVIPFIIVGVIAGLSFAELQNDFAAPNFHLPKHNVLYINVIGRQFYWTFDYPNGVHTVGTLVVPVDTYVRLRLSSPDVIHSFWVPNLGPKIDAVPGYYNYTWFKALKEGTYYGQCAEYCGVGHYDMTIYVKVVSPSYYKQWMAKQLASLKKA